MAQLNSAASRGCDHAWESAPDLECDTCVGQLWAVATLTARHVARNHADADDVAAEAVDEIRTGRKFNPNRARFSTFVGMIVRTKAAAYYRREGRAERNAKVLAPIILRPRYRRGVVDDAALDHASDCAQREVELQLMLDEIMKDMVPEDQEAFALHLAGYSRAEIAQTVLVNGETITPQRWSQRLLPIQARVVEALELRLKGRDD